MTSQLSQLRVIDFAGFAQGSPAERRAIALQIYRACSDIGFFYLKHPGMSSDLIQRLFAQAKTFFALPPEVKQQLAWDETNRGYVASERQALDPQYAGDLKEALDLGREVSSDYPLVAPAPYYPNWMPSQQANKWPSDLPQFRATALEFYAAGHLAICQVLQAFAIALDLPEAFFADRHCRQNHTLRLAHYPPLAQTPKAGQLRAGAHSDWGSITLLFQEQAEGLEVLTNDGNWIAAVPIPDTVVVNTGDLMQQWTNHEFRSTRHRVMIPADERAAKSRYSAVFFGYPDYDAEIACIKTCSGPDRPPLYPPMSAGDYLLNRIQTTY